MSTYTPIASVTLSAATSSVTFSGIPQTYTDLVVVINAGNSGGTGYGIALQCNNDTGSNYSFTQLYGTGSAATSYGAGGGGAYGVGQTSGAGGNGLIQIKYAGTQRATGGTIQTQLVSGSYYTLHTFTASGTFTPTE